MAYPTPCAEWNVHELLVHLDDSSSAFCQGAVQGTVRVEPPSGDIARFTSAESLDPVLLAYVEGDLTASELVEAGFDDELVSQVVRLVDQGLDTLCIHGDDPRSISNADSVRSVLQRLHLGTRFCPLLGIARPEADGALRWRSFMN